ncbi:MAG TPA: hypothetical protein VD704_06975, partial [Gaiellaceae bacterium]|nr:hypothetical protein [Gaiellaceae bacterium]
EASAKDELLADARRAVVRARDRLGMAGRRHEEARSRVEELEAAASAAAREGKELEERALALAGALHERPRLASEAGAPPGPGLTGVTAWGTRARAALLVARSQLSSERDALIRQANELGALVLGEQFAAATPGSVAARLERELGRRPA